MPLTPSTIVNTQTNAGSAGGTMWWRNESGKKILWGNGASVSVTSTGTFLAFTLPTFFTTIQAIVATPNSPSATGSIYCEVDTYSTTTVTVKVTPSVTTNITVALEVIGT